MLDWIKKIVWKPEGFENLKTPQNENASFQLMYDKLLIGTLLLDKGQWYFEYSDKFKNQSEISPIIDFPDVNKKYEAKDLWPFFASRIPTLNQPIVQEIIKEEKIKENNVVDLLKYFGKFTINNPFALVLV